jgi:hypothetical protein
MQPLGVIGGVLDRHSREIAEQHRLPGQRERAGDQRLRRDHGGGAGEQDQQEGGRARRHLLVERVPELVLDGRGVAQDQRALPQVAQHECREDEEGPRQANGPDAEMPHVRVERLAAGHDQDDRAEDQHAVESMAEEEGGTMMRREGPEDRRILAEMIDAERRHRGEPGHHHRAEELADIPGPATLDGEQGEEDDARERHDVIRQARADVRQPFHGAEDGDCRRDHAVAIEQGGADHGQERHAGDLAAASRMGPEPVGDDRQQGEDPPLTVVVGLHDEGQILDRDHHDERPEHQREDAEQVGGDEAGLVGAGGQQALLQGVERAGADVAEDHAERAERHRRQAPPVRRRV